MIKLTGYIFHTYETDLVKSHTELGYKHSC